MNLTEGIFTENFNKLLKLGQIDRGNNITEKICKVFSFDKQPIHAIQTFYKKVLPNGNIKTRSVGYLGGNKHPIATQTIIKKPNGDLVEHFIGTRQNNLTLNTFKETPTTSSIYNGSLASNSKGKLEMKVDTAKTGTSNADMLRKSAQNMWSTIGLTAI